MSLLWEKTLEKERERDTHTHRKRGREERKRADQRLSFYEMKFF